MKKLVVVALFTLLFIANALGAGKTPVNVFAKSFQNESGDTFLALTLKNQPGWHTYWKNPGDVGIPTSFSFSIDGAPIDLSELEWPEPKRFINKDNIWSYGYDDIYSFFFRPSPELLEQIDGQEIAIKIKWLACHDICIPGNKTISGKFVADEFITADKCFLSSDHLTEQLHSLPQAKPFPKHLNLSLALAKNKEELILTSNCIGNCSPTTSGKNLIYPFPLIPFAFKHETIKDNSSEFYIEWEGELEEPPIELPLDGKWTKPYTFKLLYNNPISGKAEVIQKEFSSFSLTPIKQKDSFSVFYYLLLALIGGLILNIMPCVLPVISFKLFGLMKEHNTVKILKHNLLYSLGIFVSFLVLALLTILLKKGGTVVGWGFQLQSPYFILFMTLVLFIFALNLFGLFEFQIPAGKYIGNIKIHNQALGYFLGGVLSTMLATPCSAPFLGTALTFALTSSDAMILGIFLSIGLGLALPFLLTAAFPGMVKILPKPGNWMNVFQKFLGLTLLLTVAWLVDIFSSLTELTLQLNILLALIFFVFYMKRKRFLILPLALLVYIVMLFSPSPADLDWKEWSVEKMEKLKEAKQTVFIDFTAKWCLTCKVNENVILKSDEFKKWVKDNNIQLLLADWTKKDPIIGQWLQDHGAPGVPAYFIQKPDGSIIPLGEVLTMEIIENHE